MLKAQVAKYEESLEVVDWYIDVFEGGQDTANIAKRMSKLMKRHEKLSSKFTKFKAESEQKIAQGNKELKLAHLLI